MSKKKLKKTVILSSALVSLLTLTHGQNGARAGMSATGACDSKLIGMTVITNTMKFGTIFPCTASIGDVTLDAKNNSISTAGCISGTFGAGQAPVVKVTPGQTNKNFKVLISITKATDTVANATKATMTVTAFDFNSKNGGSTIQIDGTKVRTIPIGGVLNVNAAQASGTYTGTFTVSASCL